MCTFWLVEALTRVRFSRLPPFRCSLAFPLPSSCPTPPPSYSTTHSEALSKTLTHPYQAGKYDKKYLHKAVEIFENMLVFGNHLSMFSEEIARSGEQLGNTPQAFSHLALISAAFNLDRTVNAPKGA